MTSGKRVLLLAVAGFLSASAALAVGILLFGDFGETEGRILATTALLGLYGLLALPGSILLDQSRVTGLGAAVVALAVAGASLAIASVWTQEPPEALGKSFGTVSVVLLALVQTSALVLRRRESDPASVRRLFAVSSGLAAVVATMVAAVIWAEIDREGYARVLGALVVLDVLAVALQPILARARPGVTATRLRVLTEPGGAVELTVEAPDLAAAAAKAIRTLERDGRRVQAVEIVAREGEANVAPARDLRRPRRGAILSGHVRQKEA